MDTNKKLVDGNSVNYISTTHLLPLTGTITFTQVPQTKEKTLEPEKIIYNERTTIVYWNDNTKTISTASIHDEYDPEIGFSNCLMKKLYGKKIYGKKLYRRMIAKAEVHGEDAKNAFFNWKNKKYDLKQESQSLDDFPF